MKIKFLLKYFSLVLLCITISNFAILNIYPNESVSSQSHYAYLQLKVVNASTHSPIENATICILNNYSYYQTNKNGSSDTIAIPLVESSKENSYYHINLLVYKSGFQDFLYFDLKLVQNQKRADIVIYLDEIISEVSPTIFIEPPTEEEISDLIKNYKK